MNLITWMLPEFFLSFNSILLLLINSFLISNSRNQYYLWISNLFISFLLFFLLNFILTDLPSSFVYVDKVHFYFRIIIFLFSLILYISMQNILLKERNLNEFSVLYSWLVAFSSFLSSTANLLVAFLLIETISIILYILVSFYRKNFYSIEAGLKYYFLGTFTSLFLLLGIYFIYYASLEFEIFKIFTSPHSKSNFFYLGFLLIFIGLVFKLGGAPFHFWLPEVYQGAPLIVFPILILISKLAFALFLTNLILPFLLFTSNIYLNLEFFNKFFFLIAFLSMLIGNLLALKQEEVKRLLAYSSIAHIGYLLTLWAIPWETDTVHIFYGYLFIYSLTLLGLLFLLIPIPNKKIIMININSLFYYLKDRNFILIIAFLIFIFSLAGLPPTAGFITKLFVLIKLIKKSSYFLAFIFLFTSILSLYYYFKLIQPILKILAERAYELKFKKVTFLEVLYTLIIILVSFYLTLSTFRPDYIFFFK